MSRLLYFKEIDGVHAADVARLATELRAPLEGPAMLRGLSPDAEGRDRNLSLGLFSGPRLVGYLIASIEDRSAYHGQPQRVVRMHEVGVLPAFRRRVRDLVLKLALMLSAYCPRCPLEAAASGEHLRRLRHFRGFARHLGYALLRDGDVQDSQSAGGPRVLRWEMPGDAEWVPDTPLPLPRRGWEYSAGGRNLEVLLISETRQWLSLQPVWNRLLRETADYTVFQSFEHLWAWWKHFGVNGALNLLAVREGTEIIGIAPLAIFPDRVRGKLFRDVELIGSPWQVDRAQFLFGREQDVCLDATLAWLFAHRDRWDLFRLHEQRADFPATRRVRERFGAEKCLIVERDWVCPYIRLDGDWERFIADRPRKLRKNLNRSRRLLEQDGPVSLETLDRWSELDQGLEAYVALEKRSWKPAKGIDVGRSKAYVQFYRELARIFGRDGGFQLRFLKVGDQRVAGTFGIEYDGSFYSIMIVHDQEFDRGSPGTLLEAMELERCFAGGIKEYDFLGGFLSNKLRWTSTARATVNQSFFQRRPRLVLDYAIRHQLKPRVRGWLERQELLPMAQRWSKQLKGLKTRLRRRPALSAAKR